jgi:hypothetical protein
VLSVVTLRVEMLISSLGRCVYSVRSVVLPFSTHLFTVGVEVAYFT